MAAGLQDQRFSINITHTGEAVHRDALLELHFAADLRGRHNDAEIHHGGRGHLAHGGDLRSEGVAHALAPGIGIGHKGSLAPLADHQPLLLQLANGLAHRVAADAHGPAQLGFRWQQVTHVQLTGGNILLDNAHQLRIQRNIAVHAQAAGKNGMVLHRGILSCAYCSWLKVILS